MKNLAPIAVFAFNRPMHLNKTLFALSKNFGALDSELYVFIDGPRNNEDLPLIRECVSTSEKYSHMFKSFEIKVNQLNLGLANSIITGINNVLEISSTVIVVEDDLITSPYFLDFINRGLTKYQNQKKVASIHGFVLPFRKEMPKPFFIRGADCWGWGTWSDRWKHFDTNGQELLDQLKSKNLIKQFNLNDSYPFDQMLKDQIAGRNNSWAIRWHASMFLQEKLTLYPARTYVENIGFDGSGTHTGKTSIYYSQSAFYPQELPEKVFESKKGLNEMSNWYRRVYFGQRTKMNKSLKGFYLKSRNSLKCFLSNLFKIFSKK